MSDFGADTEADAEDGKLRVTINNWDLDEEGLIVTDGQNTMAVPAKIMHFGTDAESRTYEVFTLGEGTLSITKTDLASGISVKLVGNTLTVSVTALPANIPSRNGTFELGFGGLRGTMQVIQSPDPTQYININRQQLPLFSAIGVSGISDGELLRVMSSSPWEATIYNQSADPDNPGFSFASGSKDLDLATGEMGTNEFDIYTTSSNTSGEARYGFVVFKLTDYPQYSQVLVLPDGRVAQPAPWDTSYWGPNAEVNTAP